MELKHLRYFIALADEPHFERAAKHCGLSASVLSRHISDLEESLGCSLFRRKALQVSLSAAGQVFYGRAKDILASAAAAAGEVRATAAALASQIRIGHSGLWWMKRYAAAVSRFKHDCPGIHLHPLEQACPAELPGALRRGEMDMALMEHVDVAMRIEFKVRRIEALGGLIVLPASHPLAKRKKIAFRELSEEVWVAWNDRLFPGRKHLLLDAAEAAHFRPCVAQDADSDYSLYDLVASAGMIGFIGHEPAEEMPRGTVLVPLHPASIEFPIFLAWRKDSENIEQMEALAALLLAPHSGHNEH